MTTATKFHTVAAWLESCGCTDIQNVNVTIGDVTYRGTRYVDPKHASTDARIYCVGQHPTLYPSRSNKNIRRKGSVCFRVEGAPHEWYVGCYTDAKAVLKEEYHPFGHSFILMQWNIPGKPDELIDTGLNVRYKRIPMVVIPT